MNKKFRRKMALLIVLPLAILLTGALALSQAHQSTQLSGVLPATDIITANPLSKEIAEKWHLESLPSKAAYGEASALFEKKDYTSAEAVCLRAVKNQPYNSRVFRLLGEIALEQGRNQKALSYLQEAARYGKGNIGWDMNVALAYCRMEETDKARKQFDAEKWLLQYGIFQADELPGTNTAKTLEASILFARGLNFDLTGRANRSLHDYVAALQIVPSNGLIAYLSAKELMFLKRYEEALPLLARAVRFGNAKDAKDAKNRMAAFPAAEREKAIREAAKIP